MTIEIRQMIIRAVVTFEPARSQSTSAGFVGAAPPEPQRTSPVIAGDFDQQAIIDAAVREVLRQVDRARKR